MKNSLIILILIILVFFYFNNKKNVEKMTSLEEIYDKILKENKADIESIRSLAIIANKLQTEDGLTVPGNLNIPGNLNVTGGINLLPSGTIVAYNGQTAPPGWAICDGLEGRPNLKGKFIYGYDNNRFGEEGGSKDAIVVSHNHGGATSEDGDHNHPYDDIYASENHNDHTQGTYLGHQGSDYDNEWFPTLRRNTLHSSIGNHSHTISSDGESGTDKNLPPYVILLYIIKL